MDKNEKIIWLHGKPTNEDENNRMNRIKSYIKDNIWSFLGLVVGNGIWAIQLMMMIMTTTYSRDLGQYYGVDMKYFDSTPIILKKLIFFAAICLNLVILFLLSRISKETKEKLGKGLYFAGLALMIFYQTCGCVIGIWDTIPWEWKGSGIYGWIILIVICIDALVLAYFLTIRDMIRVNQVCTRLEKGIFGIAFLIYLLIMVIWALIFWNRGIENKRDYEIINKNKVVITTYEGKFLVMDCKIDGQRLYIEKGNYSFMEMSGFNMEYVKFEDVFLIQ